MTTPTTSRKVIRYDRESKDYRLSLDGELVGYARSYAEGEAALDQLVYEQLTHQQGGTSEAESDELFPPLMTPPARPAYSAGQRVLVWDEEHATVVRVEADGFLWLRLDGQTLDSGLSPEHVQPLLAPGSDVPTVVVVEPSPLIGQVRHISIDSVALVEAYEAAQAAHRDQTRGWGKAIRAAYDYLFEVWSDGGAVTFVGDVLLAESGSRPGVIHLSNGSCSCEAGQRAREMEKECVCRHRGTRQLLVRMLECKARREAQELALADRLAAARRALSAEAI